MAAVAVAHVTTKSCNFDAKLVLVSNGAILPLLGSLDFQRRTLALGQWDEYDPKLRTDGVSLRKNPHNFVGSCVCGNVIVGRLAIQQQIAHTSADQIGLMAFVAKRADHGNGESLGHFRQLSRLGERIKGSAPSGWQKTHRFVIFHDTEGSGLVLEAKSLC